tara:strand:- start:349 stop:984 length:636 start_codon:yes stop_codon:yes gene_type:complete
MTMGNASEHAAHVGLTAPGSIDVKSVAYNTFSQMAEDLLRADQGEIPKQLDKVGDIAQNFTDVLRKIQEEQKLVHYNKKYIVKLTGIQHNITYVPDFEFEDIIVDTKATLAFPTDPYKTKLGHIRQASLYGRLLNKRTALLYATDKKVGLFEIPPDVVKEQSNFMLDVFKKIEKTNKLFKNAKEFIEYTVLNTDGYKWDVEAKKLANRYWS